MAGRRSPVRRPPSYAGLIASSGDGETPPSSVRAWYAAPEPRHRKSLYAFDSHSGKANLLKPPWQNASCSDLYEAIKPRPEKGEMWISNGRGRSGDRVSTTCASPTSPSASLADIIIHPTPRQRAGSSRETRGGLQRHGLRPDGRTLRRGRPEGTAAARLPAVRSELATAQSSAPSASSAARRARSAAPLASVSRSTSSIIAIGAMSP
jgi:hypothetical protein